MEGLLHREKEVGYFEQQLGEALRHLSPTGMADVTCLSGPLGVGKTTILAEFRRQASARGIPAARVDFSSSAEIGVDYLKWKQVGRRYAEESGEKTLVENVMDGFVFATDTPTPKVIQPHHSLEEAIQVLAVGGLGQ